MEFNPTWFQEHLLAIVAVVLTLVLIYHYLIEKQSGAKLSKRYRNSIFEAQSKIFLNATQYLISGNKDLAIKEFLNAVDINRETIDTYFALGGLFRSNGEIEKAISIHRSLIARENISESHRLRALKELAVDFDKGGFVDKAIETYKDVLKINRDQFEVLHSLCRIYEDVEDWDQAYNYRIMLSKVGHHNQAETISHILVQKAKMYFEKGDFKKCEEDLDDAFRFAPSVSAKILRLKLFLISGDMEQAKYLLLEILKEHPMYTSFVFVSLTEGFKASDDLKNSYQKRLELLRKHFLDMNDIDLGNNASVVLSKVRLLKESGMVENAHQLLKKWMTDNKNSSEVMKVEYIKLLIDLDRKDEALTHTRGLLDNLHQTLAKHYCKQCGYNSDSIFWRCPQCHEWETIQFRWKV
jgi:lipopolysaccharide biosynthesis regulator YciM